MTKITLKSLQEISNKIKQIQKRPTKQQLDFAIALGYRGFPAFRVGVNIYHELRKITKVHCYQHGWIGIHPDEVVGSLYTFHGIPVDLDESLNPNDIRSVESDWENYLIFIKTPIEELDELHSKKSESEQMCEWRTVSAEFREPPIGGIPPTY